MAKDAIKINVGGQLLEGSLKIPPKAKGIVLFAHGSGSSRHSPRNQFVAKVLQEGGIGTLLIDLLSQEEEREDEITRELRFNIPMLTRRLVAIVDWLIANSETRGMKIGLFGASTGAAAALAAAAERPKQVTAVVSRGGRPDLVIPLLSKVEAATLLIVGGEDREVIALNEKAFDYLMDEKKMVIVPGATHLFEEPGTLEEVARHAYNWFFEQF
ncbi:MAG: dienelactone hydrolase family protein [Chlamydiales bacterium]